ncbi:hypothetical protein BgiMline_012989, partial [Biomphalaria glabrata]
DRGHRALDICESLEACGKVQNVADGDGGVQREPQPWAHGYPHERLECTSSQELDYVSSRRRRQTSISQQNLFVSISHPHRIYLKLYTNSGNSFFQVCPFRPSLVVRADKSFKQIIRAVKGQDKRRTNPYDHVQKSLKHCPPGTLKTSVDGGNRFASFDRYSMDVNVNKIHPTLYKFSATSPTPLRCAENNGWSLGQQDRTTRESSMGGYASPRLECSLIQQTSLVFV